MKRIDINTQKPNFIGCWDLENKTLCDEKGTSFIRFTPDDCKII
jgi:hypothetical protein